MVGPLLSEGRAGAADSQQRLPPAPAGAFHAQASGRFAQGGPWVTSNPHLQSSGAGLPEAVEALSSVRTTKENHGSSGNGFYIQPPNQRSLTILSVFNLKYLLPIKNVIRFARTS